MEAIHEWKNKRPQKQYSNVVNMCLETEYRERNLKMKELGNKSLYVGVVEERCGVRGRRKAGRTRNSSTENFRGKYIEL